MARILERLVQLRYASRKGTRYLADRAAVVTRQLLAFGRRAAHRPRRTPLGPFLRTAEPVVRRLLGEELTLVVETAAAPAVWIDRRAQSREWRLPRAPGRRRR